MPSSPQLSDCNIKSSADITVSCADFIMRMCSHTEPCLPPQVFFYLFFINNLFITSTLIVGASSVITTLTGVSVEASCMLIPLGIVIYCVAGGLQVRPAKLPLYVALMRGVRPEGSVPGNTGVLILDCEYTGSSNDFSVFAATTNGT